MRFADLTGADNIFQCFFSLLLGSYPGWGRVDGSGERVEVVMMELTEKPRRRESESRQFG